MINCEFCTVLGSGHRCQGMILKPYRNAMCEQTNQFGQILLAKSISLSWYNASGVCQALVVFQIVYIAWAWVVEGRFRPVLASAFMFSSRGILGYSTQLPVPQEFLGSGVDFPVGHVSFFLFFSGHVGASIIATLDLRCVNRGGLVTTWLACAKRGSRPSLPVSQGFLIILI
uniref:AtPDCT1/2 transmembrane domain-containing protein n=1 Tax=Physcomitrium patens TaxID=3218 RepID=A0A7I4EN00_PHYPA